MTFGELNFVKTDIKQIIESITQPKNEEAYAYFFQQTKFAVKLIFQEREIFVFGLLQSLLAVLGYFLWIEGIRILSGDFSLSFTLPSSQSLTDFNLLTSLLIVTTILACPIGLLNASIGSVYLLKYTGKQSTLGSAFVLAWSRFKILSIFSLIDSWVTLQRFKNLFIRRAGTEQKVAGELLFQAWKMGTVGILPAILNGRNLVSAGQDSVAFIKENTKETLLLQIGYQSACTVVSIFTFLGFCFWQALSVYGKNEDAFQSETFVLWFGGTVLISIILIQLFLRPIFILTSVALYTEYKNKNTHKVAVSA